MPTTAVVSEVIKSLPTKEPIFICRYQIELISKRKCILQPVLDDERKEFSYSQNVTKTPQKRGVSPANTLTSHKKKSIGSLVNDLDSWKIRTNEDISKLTLMRDITNEHSSDKQKNNVIDTPKRKTRNIVYAENFDSPNKKSPKRRMNTNRCSDSEDDFVKKTPKKKGRKSLFKTDLTPSICSRKTPVVIKGNLLTFHVYLFNKYCTNKSIDFNLQEALFKLQGKVYMFQQCL